MTTRHRLLTRAGSVAGLSLLAGLALVLTPTRAHAQWFASGLINIDINSAGSIFGPGAGVVGSAGDVWNGTTASVANLKDNLNANTGVAFNLTTTGASTTGGFSGTFGNLPNGSAPWSALTLTGLAANRPYRVYLYGNGASATASTLNGAAFNIPLVAAGATNTLTLGTNYTTAVVTSNASGQIVFAGAAQRFSALQIAAAPEPGSLALIGLAALPLGSLLRRRKTL